LLAGGRPKVAEEDLANFATCGQVVQELSQGLKPGPASDAFRQLLLAVPVLSTPFP
jgi:hypothetical protein